MVAVVDVLLLLNTAHLTVRYIYIYLSEKKISICVLNLLSIALISMNLQYDHLFFQTIYFIAMAANWSFVERDIVMTGIGIISSRISQVREDLKWNQQKNKKNNTHPKTKIINLLSCLSS